MCASGLHGSATCRKCTLVAINCSLESFCAKTLWGTIHLGHYMYVSTLVKSVQPLYIRVCIKQRLCYHSIVTVTGTGAISRHCVPNNGEITRLVAMWLLTCSLRGRQLCFTLSFCLRFSCIMFIGFYKTFY